MSSSDVCQEEDIKWKKIDRIRTVSSVRHNRGQFTTGSACHDLRQQLQD